jgi:hypothetical protein
MAKIANTTKTPKVGLAILQLFDATTNATSRSKNATCKSLKKSLSARKYYMQLENVIPKEYKEAYYTRLANQATTLVERKI